LDARGNKVGTRTLHEKFPLERRFTVMSGTYLNDLARTLLPNERLTIHFILRKKTDCGVEECQHAARTFQLLANIANLFTSKLNADVIFRVQNTNIAAHKTILTAWSPVFAAMFQHQMKEKESGEVKIPDVTPAVFNKLLQFIYTGHCQVEELLAEELLIAADKYDIKDLKQLCELELRNRTLYVDTAVDLLILSDLHNAKILKESVVNFIKQNAAQLRKRPEWADLKKNYEHLAREFDVER
jgi:speckle-type POZ protein